MLSEGIRTVICGRPNAGKSSLLNLLSGADRAIVTDIEGTTRDVLEVPINLRQLSLILMDTAGLRNTEDVVEKIGVGRAKEAMEKADLILYVIDGTKGLTNEDEKNISEFSLFDEKPVIFLWNKADLAEEQKGLSEQIKAVSPTERYVILPISCLTGDGQTDLENAILKLFHANSIMVNDEVFITSARQKWLLQQTSESLVYVENGIK